MEVILDQTQTVREFCWFGADSYGNKFKFLVKVYFINKRLESIIFNSEENNVYEHKFYGRDNVREFVVSIVKLINQKKACKDYLKPLVRSLVKIYTYQPRYLSCSKFKQL